MSLYKGQCNCAYWHGIFGGLYLPHLRGAVYRHLLQAESAVGVPSGVRGPASLFEDAGFQVDAEDWDGDGTPEILAESKNANWYFAPGKGGGMWEWDLKEKGVNLGGVLSRRRETYHEKLKNAAVEPAPPPPGEHLIQPDIGGGGAKPIHYIVKAKEPDLHKQLFYDWHLRMSLLDHFLHPDTTPSGFSRARYGEQGDFVTGEYDIEKIRRLKPAATGGGLEIGLGRKGYVWIEKVKVPVRVAKLVTMRRDGSWRCDVTIENLSGSPAEIWYGTEIALWFCDPQACGELVCKSVLEKSFRDGLWGIEVRLKHDRPADLWGFPIYTISQSEEGFERTYQGSVLLPNHRILLEPGSAWKFGFSLAANGA